MRILSYTVCGVNNLFKKKMKKKLIELKNREKKYKLYHREANRIAFDLMLLP